MTGAFEELKNGKRSYPRKTPRAQNIASGIAHVNSTFNTQ